jgi:hypothetical protein
MVQDPCGDSSGSASDSRLPPRDSTPPAPRLAWRLRTGLISRTARGLHPPSPPPRLPRRGEHEMCGSRADDAPGHAPRLSRSPLLARRGGGPGGRSPRARWRPQGARDETSAQLAAEAGG